MLPVLIIPVNKASTCLLIPERSFKCSLKFDFIRLRRRPGATRLEPFGPEPVGSPLALSSGPKDLMVERLMAERLADKSCSLMNAQTIDMLRRDVAPKLRWITAS